MSLIAAILYPFWVYGGSGEPSKALTVSVPPVLVRQDCGQVHDHHEAELATLDAGKGAPWVGDDRKKAQALFACLKERKIAIQPTFFKMLGMAPLARQGKLASRCQLFFGHVDTREVANTCCLTGMMVTKGQVCAFLSYSEDTVRRVATTPALRSVASLFNKRGFPRPEEDTQAFVEWPLWWQGKGKARTLDRELLRTFCSMLNCKGLPDQRAVEDYLQRDIWWQGEGEARTLDRELLRSFSSMFCGRGLPDKKAVEDYLQWEIWWQRDDGVRTLDRALLRTFSSMLHGRGLPSKKAVDDYLQLDIWWQEKDGVRTLDRELLRTFSSMFHSRGLPDKETVWEYLLLDIWWQWKDNVRVFDRELLPIFSSMFHGKGLPNKKALQDYLQLDVWWQKEGNTRTLDRKLLRSFASIFNGRGLPDKRGIDDILTWLTWHGQLDRQALRVMVNLYSGAYTGHPSLGLPDINKLEKAEQRLRALIVREECEQDEDGEILSLIKMVALYLANDGGTQQLRWTDCTAWLQEYLDVLPNKFLLQRLLLTLHHHGGRGIKDTVPLISGKPAATKRFVLDALGRRQALASVQYALQAIEPSERRRYLFFTRELHSVPSVQQWQTMKGYLDALAPVVPNREYQRWLLTLIWPFAPADRERFVQPKAVCTLTTLIPSVQVLRKLAKCQPPAGLRALFDTYLACQAESSEVYLTVAMLRALLTSRVPMNPVIWASADYHKDKLSPSLLAQLKKHADADSKALVPDNLKTFLSRYDRQSQVFVAAPPPSATSVPWMEATLSKDVLSEADIDQLYTYRDQFTCDRVVDILFRMDQSISQDTMQRWQLLLDEKHQQVLKTNPPWLLDGSEQAVEAMRDCDDILRDLFSEPLL